MKRKTLGPIICSLCLVCFAPAARAALTIVKTVGGGAPLGVNYVTFDAGTLTPTAPLARISHHATVEKGV